mgnify:FL=1
MVIKLAADSPIRIRIADIQNFENSKPIYIHDIEKDTFINLKNQDFEVNLESGLYTNRFEITFNNTVLSNTDETFKNLKIFQNNRTAQLKLLNTKNLEIESFNLYDISGKLVMSERISSSKRKYTFSTKSLSTGIYIVKIELQDRNIFSKKIVVSNKN